MQFTWEGHHPKAGQFFMLRPLRFSHFLSRPLGVFEFNPSANTVKFLVAKAGKGTQEFSTIKAGERFELTGPLGNAWTDFIVEAGNIALVSGSAGIAPLAALVAEKPDYNYHLFAGFRYGFNSKEEEDAMLGNAAFANKIFITAEDGRNAQQGRITDFFHEPQNYNAILACGPSGMLKALLSKLKGVDVPFYVSLDNRMACGVGACLGCTVSTVKGNRRCCADGPIFRAEELLING